MDSAPGPGSRPGRALIGPRPQSRALIGPETRGWKLGVGAPRPPIGQGASSSPPIGQRAQPWGGGEAGNNLHNLQLYSQLLTGRCSPCGPSLLFIYDNEIRENHTDHICKD